jgi:hypothetical protein
MSLVMVKMIIVDIIEQIVFIVAKVRQVFCNLVAKAFFYGFTPRIVAYEGFLR